MRDFDALLSQIQDRRLGTKIAQDSERQCVAFHPMAEIADILDQLTTAVLVLDDKLNIEYLNQAAESLSGTSRAHCIGQAFTSMFRGPAEIEDELRLCQHTERPLTRRETPLHVNSQHDPVATNIAVSVLPDQNLLVEIDIIDRILRIDREAQVQNTQLITHQLIRGIAHEVKNPIGGIRGAAQLLRTELDNPMLLEYIDVIINESDRLRSLVDRMLEPVSPPRLQNVNLHEISERVVRLVSAAVHDQDRPVPEIVRRYDPSVPEIAGDPDQLLQAILNIFNNAVTALEFTENPRITLRTGVEHHFTIGPVRHRLVVCISIEDNGPGVPDQLKDQIFYPLISGRPQGTGLGLAISQAIIARHHGFAQCTSEPGCTRFEVYIPIEQQGAPVGGDQTHNGGAHTTKKAPT